MGEGSAVLVLESEESAQRRDAPVLAELRGYGATSDAHHLTEPSPGGHSAARAMKMALKAAGIDPSEVDYINAHGTATPLNDRQETSAIKRPWAKTLPGAHKLHQVHDRPSPRRRRSSGGRSLHHGHGQGPDSSHD